MNPNTPLTTGPNWVVTTSPTVVPSTSSSGGITRNLKDELDALSYKNKMLENEIQMLRGDLTMLRDDFLVAQSLVLKMDELLRDNTPPGAY